MSELEEFRRALGDAPLITMDANGIYDCSSMSERKRASHEQFEREWFRLLSSPDP